MSYFSFMAQRLTALLLASTPRQFKTSEPSRKADLVRMTLRLCPADFEKGLTMRTLSASLI